MPRRDLIFRVFVSSTFSDLIAERNALQEKVFPELRNYCERRGARFQAIDLRWGVSHEAAVDQQTMNICFQELTRCQKLSPRPNFIVLLGQRYGWMPLPAQIPASEFDELLNVMPSSRRSLVLWKDPKNAEPALGQNWYARDDNACPLLPDGTRDVAEYVLRPRRHGTPEADPKYWANVEDEIHGIFAQAIGGCGWPADEERRKKYEQSATHQEIRAGALEVDAPQEHVFCYFREITNAPPGGAEGWIDVDCPENHLGALKSELEGRLPPDHILKYEVDWSAVQSRNGDDAPPTNVDSEADLATLCARVRDDLCKVIDQEISAFEAKPELERERDSHYEFAEKRSRYFVGRAEILQRISDYLTDRDTNAPLIIHGQPGSGKTALLAKGLLDLVKSAIPNPQSSIAARFVGATPRSCDLRSLLTDLCQEIGVERVPTDMSELVTTFRDRLSPGQASEDEAARQIRTEQEVVLFLDGVDQLNPTDNALLLKWLPRELAPGVKLVMSVMQTEKAEGEESREADPFDTVRHNWPDSMFALGGLAGSDAETLLQAWLKETRRALQDTQKQEVLDKFAGCPLPLYLKLAFEEARQWASYDGLPTRPDGSCHVAGDIRGLIVDLFRRLEQPRRHGQTLPGRSLAYLAAARRGLSEDELMEILSADPNVTTDFRERHLESPPVDRLPVVVWSRLFSDLEPYMVTRAVDGDMLLSFYHREIARTIKQHYMAGTNELAARTALVDFFQPQPLFFPTAALPRSVRTKKETVNRRKVDELPWQLTQSAQCVGGDPFLTQLDQRLTDLRFVEAKCIAGKVHDLQNDYARAIEAVQPAHQVDRTAELLRFAAALVEYAQNRRARSETPNSRSGSTLSDVSPPLPPKAIDLTSSAATARATGSEHGQMVDHLRNYLAFVSATSHILAECGHEAIAIARNCASRGEVAKQAEALCHQRDSVWFGRDPRPMHAHFEGGCVRTLRHRADGVALDALGRTAISVGGSSFVAWDLATGGRLGLMDHGDDVTVVSLTPDGQIAVTAGGSRAIWGTPGFIRVDATGTKPRDFDPDYALKVWRVRDGKCIAEGYGHKDTVSALAVSADGEVMVSASDDGTLRLWQGDDRKRKCEKTIRTPEGLHSLALDAAGDRCVCVYKNGIMRVWEIPTDRWESKQLPNEEKFLRAETTPDGRLICAVTDRSVCLWSVDEERPRCLRQSPDALAGPMAISANGVIVVAATVGNAILAWDLDAEEPQIKCIGHQDTINMLAITPDGHYVLSGCKDGTVRYWDLLAGLPYDRETPPNSMKTLAVAPDGSAVVGISSIGGKQVVVIQDQGVEGTVQALPEVLVSLDKKDERPKAAGFSASGNLIVTSDNGQALDIWDRRTSRRVRQIEGQGTAMARCLVVPEKEMLVTASENGTVNVWDLVDPNEDRMLCGSGGDLAAIDVAADGSVLVTCCEETSANKTGFHDVPLRVWDVQTGKCKHVLRGHSQPVVNIVVDDRGWGAASLDQAVTSVGTALSLKTVRSWKDIPDRAILRFWDIDLGLAFGEHLIAPLIAFQSNFSFAPDGTTVVVGSFNNEMREIQIYNFVADHFDRLSESDGLFTDLAFVRGGRAILSQGRDSRIRLWDFVTHEELSTHPIDPGATVQSRFSLSRDGGIVCTGHDGSTYVLTLHNLPREVVPPAELLRDMSGQNTRRRLTSLWYAIEHPEIVRSNDAEANRLNASILENICDVDDSPEGEVLRVAAAKAARAAGPRILRDVLDRMGGKREWRTIGYLATVVAQLAGDLDDREVRKAIKDAAEHPDVRARKRIAFLLHRNESVWAKEFLRAMRQSEDVIDEFIERCESRTVDGRELTCGDEYAGDNDETPSQKLCPTSVPASQEIVDGRQEAWTEERKKSSATAKGDVHPYLEKKLAEQQMSLASGNDRFEDAARFLKRVNQIQESNDFSAEEDRHLFSLLDRLVELRCIAKPVKRLIGRRVALQRGKHITDELERCIEFVNDEFESLEAYQLVAVCNKMMDIEDPEEVFSELAVRTVAHELEMSLGEDQWAMYAAMAMEDPAKSLYCLANRYIQVYPSKTEDFEMIVAGLQRLGCNWEARQFMHRFMQ